MSFIAVAPANSSFTSLAFAFISLLGLVCTTSGHISGIDSQFGPFRQISRHSLDRVPLLCFRIPQIHLGRGINLSNSIGHKLFQAPVTSDPMQDYCTVCLSIQRPYYLSFQSAYIVYKVGWHLSKNEVQLWHGKSFLF